MQLVDSKLYISNMPSFRVARQVATRQQDGAILSQLKATSASARLLALMLTAMLVAASPSLLGTIRAAASLSLQILMEAGRAGLIALQIFGR